MKLSHGLAALAAALFVSVACAQHECCDKAIAANDFCKDCKIGYFGGVTVKSVKLYDSLKGAAAPANATCDGCKKALASNGTCNHCNVSFAGGKMYKSPVAHALANGTYVNAKDIKCEGCKNATKDHGWCDKCKAGVVGPFMYKDKKQYDGAVAAHEILLAANTAAGKCEGCAVAMVTDGTCSACKTSYKGGKPSKP